MRLPNLQERKLKKAKLTGPILECIHHKVILIMQDTKIMANEPMRKAESYTITSGIP